MGFLGHHFFVVSILSPFARVLETTIRLHLYTLTCNRTQQIWDTHRYSIYSYFQSSSYWKVNTFSKHTCQHFPKKKYNQETTHLFNPPPPAELTNLTPPKKKCPNPPRHVKTFSWILPVTWVNCNGKVIGSPKRGVGGLEAQIQEAHWLGVRFWWMFFWGGF